MTKMTLLASMTAVLFLAAPAFAHPPEAPPGHATTFQSVHGNNTCYIYGYTGASQGTQAQPQLEFYKETSNQRPPTSAAENLPVYDAIEFAWNRLGTGGEPPLAPDGRSGLQRDADHRYANAHDWLVQCMLEL